MSTSLIHPFKIQSLNLFPGSYQWKMVLVKLCATFAEDQFLWVIWEDNHIIKEVQDVMVGGVSPEEQKSKERRQLDKLKPRREAFKFGKKKYQKELSNTDRDLVELTKSRK